MIKLIYKNMKRLKNYNEFISNKEDDVEIIEEGWKDVVLGTAMLLGIGLSGTNAQTAKTALDNANTIKKIDNVLNNQEEKERLAKSLETAGLLNDAMTKIEKNAETVKTNLENVAKKKGVKINTYTTDSEEKISSKLKKGYAVSDIKITSDTVWSSKDTIKLETLLILNFNNSVFKPGSFELDESTSDELKKSIEIIKTLKDTKISSIQIESSTDTEPIKMGNDKLATLRANSIKSVIDDMGINTKIDIKTLPDQGPDIFSKTMTNTEREQARIETAQYRYVKVVIDISVYVEPIDKDYAYNIINNINVELTKVVSDKNKSKKSLITKKFKCKKIKVNTNSVTDCPIFND